MNHFYFIIDEKDTTFELWVNGECITDCFSLTSNSADLMQQLVEFADVPCYKKLDVEEIHKILLDN